MMVLAPFLHSYGPNLMWVYCFTKKDRKTVLHKRHGFVNINCHDYWKQSCYISSERITPGQYSYNTLQNAVPVGNMIYTIYNKHFSLSKITCMFSSFILSHPLPPLFRKLIKNLPAKDIY